MAAKLGSRFWHSLLRLLAIGDLFGQTVAILDRAVPRASADDPVACGAIVDRCMRQCDDRAKAGHEGIEYVQFTINFILRNVSCSTYNTSGNEIVSARPPNSNKLLSVFNVPCCQQKPLTGNTAKVPCPPTVPSVTRPLPANPVTTPLLTRTGKIAAAGNGRILQSKDDLNLVFNIMCFILLLLILLLLLKKLIKKKCRRKSFNKLPNESTHEMTNMANGGGRITIASDLPSEPERNANEVLREAVKNIPPPKDIDYQNEEPTAATKFQPRDGENGLDYVVLDPVPSDPPKSARSGSRGQSGKSEEVLIIGGGRGNIYRADPVGSPIVPNGNVGNFDQSKGLNTYDTTTSPMFSLENTPTNTIQPQLPGRNSDMKFAKADFAKRRSDSLPETRVPPLELEYDKLGTGISEDVENFVEPVSRDSAANRSFGTASLDSAPVQGSRNIYNVLDNGDKNEKRSEYYQRLKRSQRARPKEVEVESRETAPEMAKVTAPTQPYDDDQPYVKDFEILKKRPAAGEKQVQFPIQVTEEDGSIAKDTRGLPNGNALLGHNHNLQNTHQHTEGSKLLETVEL